MNADGHRKIAAILRVLDEAGQPLGGAKIARALQVVGIDLEQRMVRKYLEAMDAEGLTVNLGRTGRRLTERGRQELAATSVIEKIGYVDARGDELAFKMTLDLARHSGTVIMNLSTLPAAYLDDAHRHMAAVVRARLGMGRFGLRGGAAVGVPGLGVAAGQAVVGTVCSLTYNGLLASAGVPVRSRFGGLLEMRDGRPVRFTHIIHYDGTTLDPMEIFIKARMTSVGDAARTGNGVIGASYREVPGIALPRVHKIARQMEQAGLGGMLVIGQPSRPLLDIPVDQGRAGFVIAAGLNPIAAVEEAGIATENRAIARLCEFDTLEPLVSDDSRPPR